jgi:hypothetical protein
MSHTISFISSATTTYFYSIVESIGTDCLRDIQEKTIDPRILRYPEVDTQFSLKLNSFTL